MTFFVVSDIHSFYEPLVAALNAAGFNKDNVEHYLIVCGDCFDRGPDSERVLYFLMSLERKILIKGNHDLLLEELCARKFPYSHDKANGTVQTVQDFGRSSLPNKFAECCDMTLARTAAYRDSLINYFETENYIFVHSWVPTITKYDKGTGKPWYLAGKHYEYMKDWRSASVSEWEEAMWGNPFIKAKNKLNMTGKTIVFGHWHCSLGHALENSSLSEFDENARWDIYRNEEQGIIGIDRCTAYTGEVNVLVLEDNFI